MNNILYDHFEWIVVDDGSCDGTSEKFISVKLDKRIEFKYYRQENAGKHVALNKGIEEANGDWLIVLDSDDYYLPDCLIKLDLITNKISPNIVGITALTVVTDGSIVGDKFPRDYQEEHFFSFMYENRIKGDKTFIYKASVLRLFKFPVFKREKFLPESIVLNRISLKYKNAFVNVALEVIDYQADGLSANMKTISKENPLATSLRYQELLQHKIDIKDRLKYEYLAYKYAILSKENSEYINGVPVYLRFFFKIFFLLLK